MTTQMNKGFGYIPDLPHFDDFTVETVKKELPKTLIKDILNSRKQPKTADNSKYDSPVDDQLNMGMCTAEGSISTVENMEKRAFGKHVDASRLFTYRITREMMGAQYVYVDSGAYNRTAVKSIVKVGLIDETMWPFDPNTYTREPTKEMFMNKQPYDFIKYLRVDTGYGPECVNRMKAFVANGYPLFTGFAVYDNIWKVDKQNPVLQYPVTGDKEIGGHAVEICGYADDINSNVGQGAFRIKNSWGTGWADGGYFWMPYKYFADGIALDTWAFTSIGYVDSKQFD